MLERGQHVQLQHKAWRQDQDCLQQLRRQEGGEEADRGLPEQVDQVQGSQVSGKAGGEAAEESWRRACRQAFKLLRFGITERRFV